MNTSPGRRQLDGPPPRCILTEYGYTDTPGRWDHWPSGFLASTDTACHLDLPMKNCSLWLDNDIIVRDGEVIPEDLRARGH